MSNAHITAVRRCNRFDKSTRLLLMILADAASNGEKVTKGGFYNLPFGWTSKSEQQMMKDMNTDRRQSITDMLTELSEAGAIKRQRRLRKNALTFVDIEWLKAHAWATDATANEASGDESSESALGGNDKTDSTGDSTFVRHELVRGSSICGSDPVVDNAERGICPTNNVASQMPRKTLPSTTQNVARSTPVFDPVVDTPAPVGEYTRSRVRTDAGTTMSDDRSEAKAAPKARPEPKPAPPPLMCRVCKKEPRKKYDEQGRCVKCSVPVDVTATQIADLLSADRVSLRLREGVLRVRLIISSLTIQLE